MKRRTDIPNPGKRISGETAGRLMKELQRQGVLEPLLELLRDYRDTISAHLVRELNATDWRYRKQDLMRVARWQGRTIAPMDIIRSWTALAAGAASPRPEPDEDRELGSADTA